MKIHKRLAASLAGLLLFAPTIPAVAQSQASSDHSRIQHVIYVIMDNVHQSDIEQMPHLMAFLHRGTLMENDHTVLDTHTQDGMLSDMTGNYPDQTGVVDQSYYANGAYSSFLYWTNKDPDGQNHVLTTGPWKAFNEHGLSVGAVGTPDMELEKTSEAAPFVNASDTNPSDYLGVSVHHADGSVTFGSPNLPYVSGAPSWTDPAKVLGGFPGWGDQDPNWPLQATYEMQTHGVPVTFTYLHDVHEVNGQEAAPGTYNNVIQEYDQAFAKFFDQLASAGITPDNSLFVLTTDEGDQYMPNGERTTNLAGWLTNSNPSLPPSDVQVIADSGALVYMKDASEIPSALASLKNVPGWESIADPTEVKTLHMSPSAAPDRTPSFVVFGQPDVWYGYKGSTDWTVDPSYVWNHGTISPAIDQIWLGMVGPGVKEGRVSQAWVDHADTMPTVYALLGYDLKAANFDGVPTVDAIEQKALPVGVRDAKQVADLSEAYNALNAPLGPFSMATLAQSTQAALHATDSLGPQLDAAIASETHLRDQLAAQLHNLILQAWTESPGHVHPQDQAALVQQAQMLIQEASQTNR